MLINSQQLTGLKVETQNKTYIGRIKSFDIEVFTQEVRTYYIKPSFLEGGVFSEELIVHHRQVLDITEEKMIVVDNVVKYQNDEAGQKAFLGTKAEI